MRPAPPRPASTPSELRFRWWLALAPPLIALAVQWALWGLIRPYVWFLFYPAVFLSSRIGGLRAGLVSTVLSAGLVWWFFVSPARALAKPPRELFPALVFIAMGVGFAVFHEQLRQAQQRLAAALAVSETSTEELSRLYAKTRELDELKTGFFASVSHELRTPLTLILGPAQRLLDDAATPDAARRDLGVITRNARTLLRHVNDLLDVSRLEAGRLSPEYAECDVTHLVRAVAAHFDVLAQEKRLGWTLEVADALRAQADPSMLRQVLLNLLSNAFKFTPHGGRVRLGARADAGALLLEVGDSGPGIPPDKREVVFERFRQLDGGATRRFGGTGLGLAIARELVTLLGGTIAVAGAAEGGALFQVRLSLAAPAGTPVLPAEPEPGAEPWAQLVEELRAPPRAAAPTGVPGAPLVLVAEDNREMNRFLCDELASEYRVAAAFDGRAGLRLALGLRPDLLLADVMMPELSGDELVRAVRSHRELDAMPIVLLTAKADDELRVRLLRQGAQDYLTKPFSVEELHARVSNLLARRRASEEQRRLRLQVEAVARASLAVSEAVAGHAATSVQQVLDTIVQHAQRLTSAELAAVGVGTEPGRPFDAFAFAGLKPEQAARIGVPPSPGGVLRLVPERDAPLRLDDVRQHPLYRGVPAHHPELRTFLGVPVRFRGRAVGHLSLANKEGGGPFTEQDERLVEMLAARVGVAIETARLYASEGLGRAWLQAVVDQLPEGIILLDAQGRVTTENRAALGLAGAEPRPRDRLGNLVRLELLRPSGEPLPSDELPNLRALAQGEVSHGRELLARCADGRLVPLLVSAAPVRGADGALAGATMVLQDVTKLKELEALREEWASLVAHDLQQPVNAIVLRSDLLLVHGALGAKQQEDVRHIRASAVQLSRMVGDLLDASQLDTHRMQLTLERHELGALVREVVSRNPDAAPRVRLTTVDRPLYVRADAGRLEQVLTNLLSNALKYGQPGTEIAVELTAAGAEAELTVANRGAGIPAEELPFVFERHVRTRAAKKGGARGSGLGLHIARGLVEAHGGRIWATSVPGETTTFRVRVPLESPLS